MTIGGEDVLTISEAAKRLGLSRKTLWLQINRGVLQATLVGSVWIVTASELDRYAREHQGRPGRKPKQTEPPR